MYVYLIEEWEEMECEVLYVFLFRKYAEKKWYDLLKKNPYKDYFIVKKRLLI